MAFALTAIIPLTHLVVIRQSHMMRVERFVSVDLLKLVFLLAWAGATMFSLWVVLSLFHEPTILMIALASAIPSLLFSTAFFHPFQRLVYTALYGQPYDYDETVTSINAAVSEADSPEVVARVLLGRLPAPLGIEQMIHLAKGSQSRATSKALRAMDTYQTHIGPVPFCRGMENRSH